MGLSRRASLGERHPLLWPDILGMRPAHLDARLLRVQSTEDQLALALQQLGPSPGESAPSPPTTSTEAAPAPAAPQQAPGWEGMLLPLLLFVPLIVMMFWSSRSQQKRQQKALAELKKGDWVLTQAGLRGKLLEVGDRFAKVELSPGVKVEILKTALLGKDNVETAQQLEKK